MKYQFYGKHYPSYIVHTKDFDDLDEVKAYYHKYVSENKLVEMRIIDSTGRVWQPGTDTFEICFPVTIYP